MADEEMSEQVIDFARHGGTENLEYSIPPPEIGGNFTLDESIVKGKWNCSFPPNGNHQS